MKSLLVRFVREEAGQDLIEYALLVTLVALAIVGSATLLGGNLNTWYSNMNVKISGWATSAS